MTYQAKNNAYSTLAGSLTNVATSLTVQTGHGDRFPIIASPAYTIITLEDASGNREVIKVTARAGAADTMTIVRAQEGTSARAWAAGDSVELRMTAGEVQTLFDHVDDTTAAHAASAISNTPTGNLVATTVQAALDELQTDVDTREKIIHNAGAKTTPVDADEMGLVDSAASFVLTKITWANIKAGLKTYFDTLYPAASSLTSHTGATTGAHAASAISYAGSTNLAATDVEAALDELDAEKQPLLTNATQAEMEAGTETAIRAMSPNRVAQAIAALVPPQSGTLIGYTIYSVVTRALTSISNAATAVLTVSSADYLPLNNSPVRLTTTGALPTGLSVGVTYWVINASGTTFNLSATKGGAALGTSSAGSGTHTLTSAPYEKSLNNPSFIIVEVVGGGGGGGGAFSGTGDVGSGGGAGGYSRKKILASSLSASETVTIGDGGAAGTSGVGSGGTGGTSSFGSHCSSTGGAGGSRGAGSTIYGGAGGAGSGGDLNINGSIGNPSTYSGTVVANNIGGLGGNSHLGIGGRGAYDTSQTPTKGIYGGGGGGGKSAIGTNSGAVGGLGIIIVWEYA